MCCIFKICQTVAGIIVTSQFFEFSHLIFGGFLSFSPTVWRLHPRSRSTRVTKGIGGIIARSSYTHVCNGGLRHTYYICLRDVGRSENPGKGGPSSNVVSVICPLHWKRVNLTAQFGEGGIAPPLPLCSDGPARHSSLEIIVTQ